MNREGVYHDRGRLSYTVIGVYAFLIVVMFLVVPQSGRAGWVLGFILVLFVFFLARYVSTSYSLTDTQVRAWRIFGSRRIRLESVNRIEYGSMRELAPTGFFGSWGWRGRMWSSEIGPFDAFYTDAAHGLIVSGEGVPIYISPTDTDEFARELSRRVRSYKGRLDVDVGDPGGTTPATSG
jgi:hypothetical protein